MISSTWRKLALISTAVLGLGLVLPGLAWADPPTNDDLNSATVVPALPYTVAQDTSQATRAADDPFWCQFTNGGTVWFDYTATEDGLLRASTAGSDHETVLSANTGQRGALTSVPNACAQGSFNGATITFTARAGTTYHFMVSGGFGIPGGALSFSVQTVPPVANDNFAAAEPITALPATRDIDLSRATTEPDEPSARCLGESQPRTVWYAYTPAETKSLTARLENFQSGLTVYTGSPLLDLHEVACGRGGFQSTLFRVTAGTTYYIRVGGSSFLDRETLTLAEAAPLRPTLETFPSDPTIFEMTRFHAEPGEFNTAVASGAIDFGDGGSAPLSVDPNNDWFGSADHHYTADGTYQVRLNITSEDGRTGTITRAVPVTTHDVSIDKFNTPGKARTGDTKNIAVHVANTRYREASVTTELYKSEGSAWRLVGTLTLDVPARADRTVKFPFAYTFTAADAVAGKVAFRTVVRLDSGVRDARPLDNELISAPTNVLPSLTDLRFA